jgi:hypothetical protein
VSGFNKEDPQNTRITAAIPSWMRLHFVTLALGGTEREKRMGLNITLGKFQQ